MRALQHRAQSPRVAQVAHRDPDAGRAQRADRAAIADGGPHLPVRGREFERDGTTERLVGSGDYDGHTATLLKPAFVKLA